MEWDQKHDNLEVDDHDDAGCIILFAALGACPIRGADGGDHCMGQI